MANIYVKQHGAAISFSFNYGSAGSPSKPSQPSKKNNAQGNTSSKSDVPVSTNYSFSVKAWLRKATHSEADLRQSGRVPVYDFSLDARNDWKNKASFKADVAYSIADHMYAQLIPKPGTQPQHILISADAAQSTTLLAALAYAQQRMSQEGTKYSIWCTVYRNTIAPRLDGRNGYIFRLVAKHTAPVPLSLQVPWGKAVASRTGAKQSSNWQGRQGQLKGKQQKQQKQQRQKQQDANGSSN